jgi:hypothetical protein
VTPWSKIEIPLSPQHVYGELFNMMTGVNLVHVPYRGAGPASAAASATGDCLIVTWPLLPLRCNVWRAHSLGLRSMTFVVVSIIYAGTVLLYVGTAAWIVRAWTRRRYWHKSPSDLHYIAVGIVLLVSAGIGIVVASQIVVVLGYAG